MAQLTRQGVKDLNQIGRKPGQPVRKRLELPPEEAFMTPGGRDDGKYDIIRERESPPKDRRDSSRR